MAAQRNPDARKFIRIGSTWFSHKVYKTKTGAGLYANKLQQTDYRAGKKPINYEVVESSEFCYHLKNGYYRVAVKGYTLKGDTPQQAVGKR